MMGWDLVQVLGELLLMASLGLNPLKLLAAIASTFDQMGVVAPRCVLAAIGSVGTSSYLQTEPVGSVVALGRQQVIHWAYLCR